METDLICPKCRAPLSASAHAYTCPAGHSYDRSKEGYVNLLLNAKRGTHGDNREMILARRDFLDSGYYGALAETLSKAVSCRLGAHAHLLDAGCGEGYYTAACDRRLASAQILGIDLSKEALKLACKRLPDGAFAVGSLYDLPVADESQDALVCLFAPLAAEEFHRVLKPNGLFVMAVPGVRHLFGLKQVLYDSPYENPQKDPALEGFALEEERAVDTRATLTSPRDIAALFAMTPYYYRTPAEGRARLAALDTLQTEISFRLLIYRRV